MVLERQIVEFLEAIMMPERFYEWGLGQVARMTADRQKGAASTRLSLQNAQTSVAREIENLTRLRLRDLITDAEYLKERERLDRERIRLVQNLDALQQDDSWFEPAQDLISFSRNVVSWFHRGNVRTKRLILEIVGSNFSLRDRTLSIDAQKPFMRWGHDGDFLQMSGFVEDVRTFSNNLDSAQVLAGIRQLVQEGTRDVADRPPAKSPKSLKSPEDDSTKPDLDQKTDDLAA